MQNIIKPLNLTWDIDEGVLVLGDDIEVKIDDPMKVVRWLNLAGATVVFTDHNGGTIVTYEPEINEDFKGQDDVMLKVRGQSFRCECGSNVFKKSKTSDNLYRCNGCEDLLVSETE